MVNCQRNIALERDRVSPTLPTDLFYGFPHFKIIIFQIDFAQNFYNMSENDWVAQVKAPPKIKTRSLQESLDVLFEIPQYLYSVNDWGKNNWKPLTTKYN